MPYVTPTPIRCPVCQHPFTAQVEQILDVGLDPTAKERLLSGQLNLAVCPKCRNAGLLSSPLLYHDPAHELLLTFVPSEMPMTPPQREQLVGSMMRVLMGNIPAEARKGYLFNPQPVLTMQGLIDRVLQAEGIPAEVLDRQRRQNQLLARLLQASGPELQAVVKANDADIDDRFFQLLAILISSAQESGQVQDAQRLTELRNRLLPLASWSRERGITAEALDAQQAKFDLLEQFLSVDESDWDALIDQHAKQIDYLFLQLLTMTAESADDQLAESLFRLREKLIERTSAGQEVRAGRDAVNDLRAAAQAAGGLSRELLLAKILEAPSEAAREALAVAGSPLLDYSFFLLVADRIDQAKKSSDPAQAARIESIRGELVSLVEEWDRARSARLAEISAQIEQLLAAGDRKAAIMEALPEIDQTFLAVLADMLQRARKAGQIEVSARLQQVMDEILTAIRSSAPPEIQLLNQLLDIESSEQLQQEIQQRRGEITPTVIELMESMLADMQAEGQKALAARLERVLGIAKRTG